MDKILLFAGTTEGRNLAEFLEKNQIPTEVCVATQYGETLLEEGKYLHVHAGRLDETEMEQQIQKQQITLVIDATHPYAVIVSQNTVGHAAGREQSTSVLAEKRDGRFLETGDGGCHRSCKRGRSGSFSCKKRGADLCGDRKQRAFCLSGDPGLSGPGGGKSAFHPRRQYRSVPCWDFPGRI